MWKARRTLIIVVCCLETPLSTETARSLDRPLLMVGETGNENSTIVWKQAQSDTEEVEAPICDNGGDYGCTKGSVVINPKAEIRRPDDWWMPAPLISTRDFVSSVWHTLTLGVGVGPNGRITILDEPGPKHAKDGSLSAAGKGSLVGTILLAGGKKTVQLFSDSVIAAGNAARAARASIRGTMEAAVARSKEVFASAKTAATNAVERLTDRVPTLRIFADETGAVGDVASLRAPKKADEAFLRGNGRFLDHLETSLADRPQLNGITIPIDHLSDKRLAVLQRLIQSRGRPVNAETLMEELYPGESPAEARSKFQSILQRVRDLLGDDSDKLVVTNVSPTVRTLRLDFTGQRTGLQVDPSGTVLYDGSPLGEVDFAKLTRPQQLLVALLRRANNFVPRPGLSNELFPGEPWVSKTAEKGTGQNLNKAYAALQKELGEQGKYLSTQQGRGIRFDLEALKRDSASRSDTVLSAGDFDKQASELVDGLTVRLDYLGIVEHAAKEAPTQYAKALETLADSERTALKLSFEGLTTEEVAQQMKLSIHTVNSILSRGRQRIVFWLRDKGYLADPKTEGGAR